MMNNYKIGQLTKTMGVSSHLLKHYEKFDLIFPIKDHDTNYRYYNFTQFGRLIQSKTFRNLGFTIKDTSDLINCYENHRLNTILKNHIVCLETEIKNLTLKKQLTEKLYQTSLACDTHLNEWFIETMPARYILQQSNNRTLIEENHSLIENVNLIDHLPITESILYIPKENLESTQFKYHWSLGITLDAFNLLDLPFDQRFIKIESHRAFVTYLKVPTPYTTNSVLINNIKSQFNSFPFKCCGDLLAIHLKSTCEQNQSFHFFKIYIPIE